MVCNRSLLLVNCQILQVGAHFEPPRPDNSPRLFGGQACVQVNSWVILSLAYVERKVWFLSITVVKLAAFVRLWVLFAAPYSPHLRRVELGARHQLAFLITVIRRFPCLCLALPNGVYDDQRYKDYA